MVCAGPVIHRHKLLSQLLPADFGSSCRPRFLDTYPHQGDVIYPMGSTVRLPCRAVGAPRPGIQWRAPNGILEMSDSRLDDQGRTLVLSHLTEADEGTVF